MAHALIVTATPGSSISLGATGATTIPNQQITFLLSFCLFLVGGFPMRITSRQPTGVFTLLFSFHDHELMKKRN